MNSEKRQVRTTRLESWESIPNLETAWKDLLNRSLTCSVFQSLPWLVSWWRAFGGPHEFILILGYVDSRLVGIAPMMITWGKDSFGRPRKILQFMGNDRKYHTSDYCDFIIDPNVPEALDALLEEICTYSAICHRIELSNFPTHSPNQARTLEYFKSRNIRTSVEFQADAPVRILGDSQADLKTANKHGLKNHTNFLRKSGDLRFHKCGSEAEILGFLDTFFEQHKARWALTDSPSQFLDTAQRSFYRDLVRELFPYGWLRFDVVLFNGAPLAFHFGFEYRRRFILYKPTFDIQFASKSPGQVLIKFLLEDAIEKGLEEFDFAVGSDAYKYRFANKIRSNNRLIAFFSRMDYGGYRIRSVLKKLLRRNLSSKRRAAV